MLVFCLGYPVAVSGMITVPVSGQMYQTVVTNLQPITGSDGTVQVMTPIVHVPKVTYQNVPVVQHCFIVVPKIMSSDKKKTSN